jgi:hypothetical protein
MPERIDGRRLSCEEEPGRSNYYINVALHAALAGEGVGEPGEQ